MVLRHGSILWSQTLLVLRTGDTLMIDEIGRDFLGYLVFQRLLENKPW